MTSRYSRQSPVASFRHSQTRFLVLAALCVPLQAWAQDDGISTATVVVGADSPSEGPAVLVGQMARQGFERNPRYAALSLETVLGGAEASARRLRLADDALDRGTAAYDAFELAPALEALSEAVVAYEQALDVLVDVTPLVDTYRFRGAAFALSGDEKNAMDSFVRALSLDGGASMSDGAFPENVQALFDQARAKLEGMATGTVTVYAAPAAAEVWVDGRFRGASPLSVDGLSEGRHYIRVRRDGYVAFGTAVDVGRNREETVQATLRPTEKFAKFDDLRARLATGSVQGAAELAAMLKVDQLFWAVVEGAGDDIKVSASITDGVSGKVLLSQDHSFVTTSVRFRSDVEAWLGKTFRQSNAAIGPKDDGNTNKDNAAYLPDQRVAPKTPASVYAGWGLIGGSAVPTVIGIAAGVYSLYVWDTYKNSGFIFGNQGIQNQLQPEIPRLRGAFLAASLTADVSFLVAGATLATGIVVLILGKTKQAEVEDVLASSSLPLRSPLASLDPGELANPSLFMEVE